MSMLIECRHLLASLAIAGGCVALAPAHGQACADVVEPTARSFGSAGGTGSFSVRAPFACAWTATPTQTWIAIVSGGAGNGNGTVVYSVSPSSGSRAGRIELGTAAHVVSQAAFASLPSKAGAYLNNVFDQFQSRYYVYRDADNAANHFAARGRFPEAANESIMPPMDEVSKSGPCMQFDCITAEFKGTGNDYGGWYFLNGVLSGNDRTPRANWGDVPGAGVDLSGATELVFWARGEKGGEVVEFFTFGVGRNPVTGVPVMPYPDSSPKQWAGFVTLTNTWRQYRISLNGDLSYVLGGFGWGTSAVLNGGKSIKFYLDEIWFNKSRPHDIRFLLSYEAIRSDNPFDSVNRNAAYLYDNALALVYFTAMGDAARSKILADAILYAISHERFYTDNRIRNAYQAGDLVLPRGWSPNGKPGTVRMPGWFNPRDRLWYEDQTHVSTSTGNVAWCMLGLLSYYGRFGGSAYLEAAKELGEWVTTAVRETRPGLVGFTGGFDGWEPAPLKRLYKSTEHNLDLMAAFRRLYRYTNEPRWLEAEAFARQFVVMMWDPMGGEVLDRYRRGRGHYL